MAKRNKEKNDLLGIPIKAVLTSHDLEKVTKPNPFVSKVDPKNSISSIGPYFPQNSLKSCFDPMEFGKLEI